MSGNSRYIKLPSNKEYYKGIAGIKTSDLCVLFTHFLYSKLIELGEEELSTRVLTTDKISEVS